MVTEHKTCHKCQSIEIVKNGSNAAGTPKFMSILKSDRWIIPICFAIIYTVWGSTYLANWYAIQDIPPFLMSGSRFLAAGTILLVASSLVGSVKPTLDQWKNAAFNGTLLLAVGTGGMVWSEQFINSGMVALMAAFQPLLIVLMMWQLHGKRPTLRTVSGTILGMIGMTFLVGQDQFISNKDSLIGIAVIFISIVAWGFASIRVGRSNMPQSKLQSAGMQMFSGGAVLIFVSALTGEMFGFSGEALTSRGVWSWIYLVVFGSLIAFSAFNYLLVHSTPDKVATSNYINPIVALLLGWGLNNEALSGQSLIAAVFLLTGVVFINTRLRISKKSSPHPIGSLLTSHGEETKEIDINPFSTSGQNSNVIARIWHGKTPAEKAEDYIEWTKNTVAPDFKTKPGNLGLTFSHHTEGEVTHLTFISYWKDYDSIRQYAGKDYKKAHFYPREKEYLSDFEEEVEHKLIKA